MIVNVDGNILNAPEKVIAHGCNCKGVMGAGVAQEIRARWPQVYKVYRDACSNGLFTPGSCLMVPTGDGKIIANLGTQDDYRGPIRATTANIRTSLTKLRDLLEALRANEVAMPRIGAGYGGLNWAADVLPIVDEVFADNLCRIKVVVYSIRQSPGR